jgi:hypothetical protein
MGRIRVLSPVGVERADALAVPPLPAALTGRTVGFLDNTKANFDRFVAEMTRLLVDEHGVGTVIHRRKANASSPAPAELVAELRRACDLVLAGSAD